MPVWQNHQGGTPAGRYECTESHQEVMKNVGRYECTESQQEVMKNVGRYECTESQQEVMKTQDCKLNNGQPLLQ
jgi:hypothetical protein